MAGPVPVTINSSVFTRPLILLNIILASSSAAHEL